MTPVSFGTCFGWLHPGHSTKGVVLCTTFGHENMNAHRGWGHLAELLADRGFHVLRFDYPGTGDSLGFETDPSRLTAWQDSIEAAVGFLRSATDADGVILIGLRLGATLALMASQRIERVDAVGCLAPVLSGKSYVRERQLLSNAWREANLLPDKQRGDGSLDVVGETMTRETLQDIAGIDVDMLLRTRVRDILLMQEADTPALQRLQRSLEAEGRRVYRLAFPGAADYLQDSLSSKIPEEAFGPLVEWCTHFLDSTHRSIEVRPDHPTVQCSIRLPDATEEPFSFGEALGLFGILCRPTNSSYRRFPTVIMVNTGFGRHIGDARVFVTLARRLASLGVASLRMDLTGFGDSVIRQDLEPDPYSGNVTDVIAAVDALENAGYGRPYLVGTCSGAYTAFHGALAEMRIRGLILVNIQKFIWNSASSLKVGNRQQRRPLSFYFQAVLQQDAWRRLARGDVAFGEILMTLGRRPFLKFCHNVSLFTEQLTGAKTRSGQIMRWFRELNSREVHLRLIYSEADPGLSELAHYFGRKQRRLRNLPHTQVHLLAKADHALLDPTARLQFIDMVCHVIEDQKVIDAMEANEATDSRIYG